jgi:hypothetical protein
MEQRGRKSSAALGTVMADCSQRRPEPPADLTSEQRVVWESTVNALRGDWFWGSEPILKAYCEHVSYSDQIARELNQRGTVDEHFADLAALHRAQSGLIVRLATALRLTPQSTFSARTLKHVSPGPKPRELARDPDPSSPDWQ